MKILNQLLDINFLSYTLGFIGTILIFFYGLPPKVDPDGHIHLILEQEDKLEKRKGKIYKKIGYLGIILIAISFLLQIVNVLR